MADVTLKSKVIVRNDTVSNWVTNKNKVLLKGEIGLSFDTVTNQVVELKIGDGVTTWEHLKAQSLILQGATAPDSSTGGHIGQIYVKNTDPGTLYICTGASGGVYVWEEIEDTLYDLGASNNVTEGVDVTLTGSDLSTDTITFVGVDGTSVYLDGGQIKIESHDDDTFLTDLAENKSKVVTSSTNGTTLGTTDVIDLLLTGYTKQTVAGQVVATDTLEEAISKLQNALDDLADGMVYLGAIAGGAVGAYGALTPEADKGHTYKVNATGQINGVNVVTGDLIICNTDDTPAATTENYTTIAANWDVFSFDERFEVNADNVLTLNQLVVGTGTRGVVTLSAGSEDEVLQIKSGVPSWETIQDTDTYIDTVNTSNGITASLDATFTELNISIESLSTDLLTQGTNTLVLDGGNSVTP